MDDEQLSAKPDERGTAVDGLDDERVRAFGHLLEGSHRLLAAIEADLKADAGMTLSELEVLIHLAQAPEQRLRPTELASRCVMTTSGCTRLLDRLEDQRLIERRAHGIDRRGLEVLLSPRGRKWLESVLPDHFASLRIHLWDVLSSRELRQLGDTMRSVRDANS